MDRCLQLFGGYGYMMEYPIARLYTDARVARIYAGTSEVMKVIIAKSLGCDPDLQRSTAERSIRPQHVRSSPCSGIDHHTAANQPQFAVDGLPVTRD